ncbi:amidohydrolase family protein [Williamsia sp. R60]
MLIRDARQITGEPIAVSIADGRLAEVGTELAAVGDEEVLDARGGTLLPGLHDHHLHLRATIAAFQSVKVGPPHVKTARQLKAVLDQSAPRADGWIRAVGYHDSVAGELDRNRLDELFNHAPLRIQHRSGALWMVNTLGLVALNQPDHPTGRFFRQDAQFASITAGEPMDFAPLSTRLAAFGVTGFTEATPDLGPHDLAALEHAIDEGQLRQRVVVLSRPGGQHYSHIEIGPVKRILDDSSLDLDELTLWIAQVHADNTSVAMHCVTVVQLVVAVAALRGAGVRCGDRIEHAAMVPEEMLSDLRELGVTVVTQPNFVAERGDQYLVDVPAPERHMLWRVASLRRAGVPVAGSTDAPFGEFDPWAAMRAARDRVTVSGAVLSGDERVDATTALNLFTGDPHSPARPRKLAKGARADLCLMSAGPEDVLAELSADIVATTIVGGRIIWP